MTLTQINKAGLDELALDHVFTIGASGSSAYTFQGEGLNGTVNNPTLYLTRGKTYRFENGSGGHPIRIQSTSGASGTAYNTGVTNNAGSGTVIVEVQHDAPDVLYYQCTSHAAMNGILYITGALADGGVTTAKLEDDAVTDAKLANSINSAIAANTAKTSLENDSVSTAKIQDDAVTADKLANSINTEIAANTAKTTNATHTGEVTGGTTLTIASDVVDEDNLKVSNSPTNGYFLSAQSGNTGGLTWAEAGGGKIIQVHTTKVAGGSSVSYSNVSSNTDFYPLETTAITVSAGTTLIVFANYHYWMQDVGGNIMYGVQGLQAEVGGSGTWNSIRDRGAYETFSMATVNAGGGAPSVYPNQIADIASLNATWTHGQSAGTTVKVRINHKHQGPNSCDLVVFSRYGVERNIIVYEVAP